MNRKIYPAISIALVWLSAQALHAIPSPGTPPFVANGSNVTTPYAAGTYTHSNFVDPSSGYTIVVEPISGQTLLLKNPGSVISVGDGSNITIKGLTTLKSNNNVVVIKIKGDGTLTTGSDVTITGFNGVNITGVGTVTNAGTIHASDTYGIQVDSGKVTNTGMISADNGPAILTTNAITVLNSGMLGGDVGVAGKNDLVFNNTGIINVGTTGVVAQTNAAITNSGVITSGSLGVWIQKSGTVTNSGMITGSDSAVYFTGAGTLKNSGTLNGGTYGVFIQKNGTVENSGAISSSTFGVVLAKGGTLKNSGVITGDFIGVASTGSTSITNSGVIQATTGSGVAIQKGTITNSGVINGNSGPGIVTNKKGIILLQGGSVTSSGAPAIVTNTTGGKKSTVTIQGRAQITGGILSAGKTGILNLNLVGMTPAQASAINAMSGSKNGDFFIGSNEYQWTHFKLSAHAVSLQQVVDSGLVGLATRIDNANQGLSMAYDPLYVAAASDPEAALNNFAGREFLNAFSQVGLSSATTLSALADERAFSVRSGATGVDLTGLSINSSSLVASLDNVRNVLNHMTISDLGGTTMSDSKEAMFTNTSDLPWGVWASGAVTIGSNSGSLSDPAYHTTVGSPTIGFDYHLFPEFVVGGLVNYTTSGAYFGDGSQLNADTILFGGYADWAHDHWFVNGLVAGGFNSYDQSRNTLGGTVATASPDGSEALANVSGGYDFKIGSWMVSPEAGLNYTHLEKDSFSESGGGAFDLNVGEQDVNSLRTKLGFHATNSFKWDGMKFTPELHANWYHECLDNTNGVSTSVPGAPAIGNFLVTTTPTGRNFALVGAGLSITPNMLNDQVTFFLTYDAQVGQDNYISHTADGGLRIGF